MLQLRRSLVRALASSPSSAPIAFQHRQLSTVVSRCRSCTRLQQITFAAQRRCYADTATATQAEPEADGAVATEDAANSIARASSEESFEPFSDAKSASEYEFDDGMAESEDSARSAGSASDAASLMSKATSQASSVAGAVADKVRAVGGFGSTKAEEFGRPPVPPNRSLYIGNLPFNVTSEMLEEDFARIGPVRSVRIIFDQQGLSKGFAYVEFNDVQTATKALEAFDDQSYEGRRLNVQYSIQRTSTLRPHPGEEGGKPLNPVGKTVFIGNMSFEMSDRDLSQLFRSLKNVLDVRVAIDRRTGQPRGFAHADFVDVDAATAALKELRNMSFHGRRLRVDYSMSSGRSSMGPSATERSLKAEQAQSEPL